MNKYNAKKVKLDNIDFDSKAEADKYAELKLLQRAGEVIELELQPKFVLQPRFKHKGKVIRPITYKADFRVVYKDGKEEVIDVKGYKTRDYLLRKKMLLYKYPEINFVECG